MRMKTLLHKTTHFREKSAFVIMVTWMGLWYGLFANEGLMFAWWTSLEFSGGTSICCRWNYKKFVVRYKAFRPVFWQDEIQRLCLTIGHIVLQSRTNSPAGRALERPSQNFGRRLRGWIHQRKEKNRNWLPIYGLRGWGDAHCLSLQRSIGSLLDWWIHWCSIEVKALLSLLDSFTNFSSTFQDSANSTLAACWTITTSSQSLFRHGEFTKCRSECPRRRNRRGTIWYAMTNGLWLTGEVLVTAPLFRRRWFCSDTLYLLWSTFFLQKLPKQDRFSMEKWGCESIEPLRTCLWRSSYLVKKLLEQRS